MMADKENIFQRMSKITQEMAAVAKNLQVGYGNNHYNAVGEADILAAVKPLEGKHGVYSYPIYRQIVESGTMERETKGGKSVQLYMRIKVTYRFLCVDWPESYLDIESFGDGVDTQDKAPGKAMTYADKYALMKAYKILTGVDPDQYESEPQEKVTAQEVAFPSREEMLKVINDVYGNKLKKILDCNNIARVEDMTEMQVRSLYTRATK